MEAETSAEKTNSSPSQTCPVPKNTAEIKPREITYISEWNQFKKHIDEQRNSGNLPVGDGYITRETVDNYFQKKIAYKDYVKPLSLRRTIRALQWYADHVEHGKDPNIPYTKRTHTKASLFVVMDSAHVKQSIKDQAERYKKRELEKERERESREASNEDPAQILPLIEKMSGKCSKLLLRLVADMFRQHADLFSQQAQVLEKVATKPELPSSWQLEDETPEKVQQVLLQQRTSAVAMKSYEGVLQVQKRVNYLDSLFRRSGIKTNVKYLESRQKKDKALWQKYRRREEPMYWFRRDNFDHILEEVKIENPSDSQKELYQKARRKIETLWASMNPAQRLYYIQKAQAAAKKNVELRNTSESRKISMEEGKISEETTERGRGDEDRSSQEKMRVSSDEDDVSDDSSQESMKNSSDEDGTSKDSPRHASSDEEIPIERSDEEDNHSDDFSEALLGQNTNKDGSSLA